MLMTEKKPPTRIGTILVWLILIIGMLWLAIPKQASSQTLMEAGHVTSHESADPFKLYPNGIEYDVYRKGKKIGQHKVKFKREDGQLIVDTEFKIKVKIFFVTVYRFIFDAAGTWQDGKLVSMTGEVNDNGKKIKIVAYVDDDGKFYTTGKKGAFVADTWVYPTNHWNIGAVDQSVVLNTLTGNLAKVEVVRHGIETVETVDGPVEAEKFEYTGDLRDTNVWYDSEGRWVKMVFTTKAGETVELVCRQCGLVNDLEQASASGT